MARPSQAAGLGRILLLRKAWNSLQRTVPARTGIVVLSVCLAGAAVVGLALWGGLHMVPLPVAALLVAATLAEAFPVPIEGVAAGATSFANVVIVATAVLYGWRSAILVGAL